MRLVVYFIFCNIIIGESVALAQTPATAFISERVTVNSRAYPVEKIFVHTDKPQYLLGEDIWYKIYLTDGKLELPSGLSEVVYVQFLAPDNTLIETQKIEINEGTGHGDFQILSEYGEGIYSIRAYTNWMLNNKDYLFKMDLPIYDFRIGGESKMLSSIWEINKGSIDLLIDINKNFIRLDSTLLDNLTLNLILDSLQYEGMKEPDTINNLRYRFQIPMKHYRSAGVLEIADLPDNFIYSRIEINPPLEHIDLKFYPEGGYLVNNIISKLAFKAIGTDGLSRNVKGNILDGNDSLITSFESVHNGMGFVPFRPEEGKSYKAIIVSHGDTLSYSIPSTFNVPFVFSARQSKEHITLVIRNNPKVETTSKPLVLAQSGNNVIYSAVAENSKGYSSLKVSKDKFPEGIVQFTLFNGKVPVAERLVFVEKETPEISISTNKKRYQTRDRVKIKLNISGSGNKGFLSNLSVSAIDASRSLESENKENIRSYLLLSSDLKGNIEEPGYYFNKQNKNRKEHIDILMMTQGWSRFVWDSLLQEDLTLKIPDYGVERGLSLKGRLNKLINKNKEVYKGEVSLLTEGETQEIYTTAVSETGDFYFNDLDIYGKVPVNLYGKNEKGKPFVSFSLDTTYHLDKESKCPYRLVERIETRKIEKQLSQGKKAYEVNLSYPDSMDVILLEGVTIKDYAISEVERDKIKYNKVYDRVDSRINMEDIPGSETAPTIFDLLRGRVPGFVYSDGIYPEIRLRGGYGEKKNNYPLFIIDGIQTDLTAMLGLNMNDIDHIDVLKQIASGIYGARGANGVIAVYTKQGEQREMLPSTGEYRFMFEGYKVGKEFYSPNYSVKQQEHSKPDLRSTLYWNPEVKTNKSGNAEFSFYTHDGIGEIDLEIQGLDSNGNKYYKRSSLVISE